MALEDNDKEWIKRLVEGVSDSFAEAMAGEIGPLRTTLKETLSVQKQTLDAQERLRTDIKTELPRALANVIQPKLDESARNSPSSRAKWRSSRRRSSRATAKK